jgi:hypothetical protein
MTWYVHTYEVWLSYGGPEEGGWHYEEGSPTGDRESFSTREQAEARCRELNEQENERRQELRYGFTSVLSNRETFYAFRFCTAPEVFPYPEERPHYE